jgi:hypothetical protein
MGEKQANQIKKMAGLNAPPGKNQNGELYKS